MKRGPTNEISNPSDPKAPKKVMIPLNQQLIIAIRRGDTKIAQLLIKRGANVNQTDIYGRNLLCWAGKTETAKLLIESGVNINQADTYGDTPLHTAAKKGDSETAKLLIESGADVNLANKYGYTPLHDAAKNGATETAKLLIESGANVNQADNEGRAPLHEAAFESKTETVNLLVKKGANVNQGDNAGRAPLHVATGDEYWDYNTVKLLIKSGANVNQADNVGRAPLHGVARFGNYHSAKLLIKSGANVNQRDNEGRVPLHRAAKHNHTEIAKLLIEKDASVHVADYDGETPLILAMRMGHTDVKRALEDSFALKGLIRQVVTVYYQSLPFWKQVAANEYGEVLLKRNLFRIMYPRKDAVLSCYHTDRTRIHFVEKLAEFMINNDKPTPDCFDSFFIQNNMLLNTGRALPILPKDVAKMIAGYIPGDDRANRLFLSGYTIQKARNKNETLNARSREEENDIESDRPLQQRRTLS